MSVVIAWKKGFVDDIRIGFDEFLKLNSEAWIWVIASLLLNVINSISFLRVMRYVLYVSFLYDYFMYCRFIAFFFPFFSFFRCTRLIPRVARDAIPKTERGPNERLKYFKARCSNVIHAYKDFYSRLE